MCAKNYAKIKYFKASLLISFLGGGGGVNEV